MDVLITTKRSVSALMPSSDLRPRGRPSWEHLTATVTDLSGIQTRLTVVLFILS